MDPSSVLHSQDMGIGNNSLENMLVCSKSQQDKKPRPQQEEALRCPRCDSLNTKFCYYNNYSLTQPRYFCKSCRRYWTKGGTLRNVPVGGGCRKNNKRPSSSCSSSSSISSKLRAQDHLMNITTHNNSNHNLHPHLSFNDCNDLTLAFSRLQNNKLGFDHHDHLSFLSNNNHYDHILGNPNFTNASTNFHHVAPNDGNFENMYYGGGAFGNNLNNNMGEVVDNGNDDQMMLPFVHDVSGHANTQQAMVVTTMKQESEDNNNRILWGFPWQQIGENGNNNMGDHLDLGRDSNWNGSLAPSWHGLLNSTPLM